MREERPPTGGLGSLFKYIAAAALATSFLGNTVSAKADVAITVDYHKAITVSKLSLGCTRTERDLDNVACDPKALASATKLIDSVARYQNAHIFGWGERNPEPSPGVYDWTDLDRRMKMIRAAHAVPVITLCGAPDWMKGGVAGQTDWKKLTYAPLPEHYSDFAALAAATARRYPDVLRYQVWNEMKGFWDNSRKRWNIEGYTDMYNQVYDSLKAVNPAIQVGGPYLTLSGTGSNLHTAMGAPITSTSSPVTPGSWTVLDYWNSHKHGADFFVVDRALTDYADPNKLSYTLDQKLALTHTFEDIAKQLSAKTDLPIWFAEYYIRTDANIQPDTDVLNASSLYHMLLGGTSVAMMWQPMEGGNPLEGLVTDCRQPGGGQATPFYNAFAIFSKYFGPGTKIYETTGSPPDLEVLASANHTLLINKSPSAITVRLNGKSLPLAPYAVTLE